MFSNVFSPENRADYEIMWKNIVELDGPQMVARPILQYFSWCMRIACWISKATNTHSGCVLLPAFQQHSSVLRDMPVLLISSTLSSIVLCPIQLLRCISLKLPNVKFLYTMQQSVVCVSDRISVLSYAGFESLPSPAGQRLASAKLWAILG